MIKIGDKVTLNEEGVKDFNCFSEVSVDGDSILVVSQVDEDDCVWVTLGETVVSRVCYDNLTWCVGVDDVIPVGGTE